MMNRQGNFKGLLFDFIFRVLDDVFAYIAHDDTQLTIISVMIENRGFIEANRRTWAYNSYSSV